MSESGSIGSQWARQLTAFPAAASFHCVDAFRSAAMEHAAMCDRLSQVRGFVSCAGGRGVFDFAFEVGATLDAKVCRLQDAAGIFPSRGEKCGDVAP
ncbi:hypothetical protein FHS27_005221 [Rhodopirellula rubra]|uniref:Uncharacterized protein n=1 Tax=Aporhodopirellula rubra TaxID=980271 RepID=A0A7W5E378_9BACT|nr:hypothetical protein [Aporhodopirellula rubra]MBB3209381.1 hypothetical protein [Aporhodopirellula rubra]